MAAGETGADAEMEVKAGGRVFGDGGERVGDDAAPTQVQIVVR